MKKLLSLLGAIGLTATTGATVVACGQTDTKTDVQNDVVTSQDYQIATQNLQEVADSSNYAEGDLIRFLENHLRGYLNPLFLNLIGQNVDDIGEDYEIQGITEEAIIEAIKAVAGGAEKAQIENITIRAKDNAKYLSGEVVLPAITILSGTNLADLIADVKNIIVECEGYLPTHEEILEKINDEIAKSTGELEKLKIGHITFQIYHGQLIITGNGLFYGTIIVGLDSKLAKDIGTVIVPGQNDLGKLGFIQTPTADQLFAALTNKFGEDYNAENLEIITSDETKTTLMGRNMFKGQATVTYTRDIFDLDDIINKNLGALENSPTTKEELVAKINAVNEGLGLTVDMINLSDPLQESTVSVDIAAKEGNEIVHGSTTIEWSIKQYDLTEVIKTSELGPLAISADKQTILDAINKANNTKLILDKDVTIDEIRDSGEGVRTAVVTAVAGNPKYTGSTRVSWTLIADLTVKNVERAIFDLRDQGRMRFTINVGSSVKDAQAAVAQQLKTMLSENYAVPEAFGVAYSEFPEVDFLAKATSPNNPWVATDEAQMFITLNQDEPVAVTVSWRIDVVVV